VNTHVDLLLSHTEENFIQRQINVGLQW